ncbi:MAG: sigma-70 family RNA polymerase sigma factor [Bryobacteraceae bacterium]|nr:sigma-70 family RNA polymerase sigma factor [Bryobacteraceae bacterium]
MTDLPRTVELTFDEIVRRREVQVLRTAYRILGNWADAEDVAQEAFVRLHRHKARFANDAALGGWLYRVIVNLCLDRRRSARPWQPLTEAPSARPTAETAAIGEERKRRLMEALAKLPVKERAAVVLREIEGLSTAETAAALGSSEVTVRSQISKALARLRNILKRGEL